MINVAIADDHPLVREGIKKVLGNEVDIELTGEATDGHEIANLLKKNVPDILILDFTMPGKSGLDLIKDISKAHPSLPILLLSIHPAERFAVRSLKAGASGYLCKSSISEELVNAIRKIINQNKIYITQEVADQLAIEIDHKQRPAHQNLSDREFEVLCMIAGGKSVNNIADELSLSPNTIHTYRSRIKDKMKLSTNVEMTRYALENGLIN